jgi:hypothetical protein
VEHSELKGSAVKKELTLSDGQTVSVGLITVRDAKEAQLATKTGDAFNDAFLIASLKAGGHQDPEQVLDSLGFFTGYREVQDEALRINGLKAPAKGEGEPAAPAASTSDISTAASPAGAATE